MAIDVLDESDFARLKLKMSFWGFLFYSTSLWIANKNDICQISLISQYKLISCLVYRQDQLRNANTMKTFVSKATIMTALHSK